ncbi:MAG: AMP-binding protein, partial [Candidatus Binatia bacterium]
MSYQSLAEMFVCQAKRYGNRVLYRFARDSQWHSYTWEESFCLVREIALGLVSLGVKKGDRVVIFSANRVEWSLIDWANICIGALTVPLYPTSAADEVGRILDNSESTVLFVDTAERIAKVESHHPAFRHLKEMILIEPTEDHVSAPEQRVLSLDQLREMGRRFAEVNGDLFDRLVSSLRPEDELT